MNELFHNIDPKQKQKLLRSLEGNTYFYQSNHIILSNLKKDNIIGIIIEGHIQITKTDYNGNRIIIEDLKENSVFGTMTQSISYKEYDIYCKANSKIIIIDFDQIINYDESKSYYFTQFLKNLLKILSEKIIKTNERIEILTNKTIRDKLLAYFKFNSKNSVNRIIYLPFTFTDLADYLAVNRSAMTRELKNLKEEGFIEIKGKKIKLLYDLN